MADLRSVFKNLLTIVENRETTAAVRVTTIRSALKAVIDSLDNEDVESFSQPFKRICEKTRKLYNEIDLNKPGEYEGYISSFLELHSELFQSDNQDE